MEDCEENCGINPYERVLKDIHDIYNPAQINSRNHAYASSPRRRDEVKAVIKKFVNEAIKRIIP